jgi:hypothetical protein
MPDPKVVIVLALAAVLTVGIQYTARGVKSLAVHVAHAVKKTPQATATAAKAIVKHQTR